MCTLVDFRIDGVTSISISQVNYSKLARHCRREIKFHYHYDAISREMHLLCLHPLCVSSATARDE